MEENTVIGSQKDIALSRFSGEFVDKAMEFKFLQAGWEDRRRQLRVAMTILGPAYFLAIIVDFSTLGMQPAFWILAVFRSLELLGAGVVFHFASSVRLATRLSARYLYNGIRHHCFRNF